MSNALELWNIFKSVTCTHDGCGVTFALSADFVAARRKDHATWYCPNGHERYYPGKSEAEKLRDELSRKEKLLASERNWRQQVIEQRDRERRSNASLRGVVTRQKRRAAAGVCQCCKRTFDNVARHMKSKHPNYTLRALATTKGE